MNGRSPAPTNSYIQYGEDSNPTNMAINADMFNYRNPIQTYSFANNYKNYVSARPFSPNELQQIYRDAASSNYSGHIAEWETNSENGIIDDDLQSYDGPNHEEESEITPLLEEAETPLAEARTISEGLETAEAVEGATPYGIAAIALQQIGSIINNAADNSLQNQISSNKVENLQQHGMNLELNSDIISQNQENYARSLQTGGAIGSFLGPAGTLIGRAIASMNEPAFDSTSLNTAGSASGWINPEDSNVVASASAVDLSGDSTIQDNVTS